MWTPTSSRCSWTSRNMDPQGEQQHYETLPALARLSLQPEPDV